MKTLNAFGCTLLSGEPSVRCSQTLALLGAMIAICWSTAATLQAEEQANVPQSAGAAIFKRHCAECHGAGGEGTPDHYAKPLAGELSAAELASYIAQSMPPEQPGMLSVFRSRLIESGLVNE